MRREIGLEAAVSSATLAKVLRGIFFAGDVIFPANADRFRKRQLVHQMWRQLSLVPSAVHARLAVAARLCLGAENQNLNDEAGCVCEMSFAQYGTRGAVAQMSPTKAPCRSDTGDSHEMIYCRLTRPITPRCGS